MKKYLYEVSYLDSRDSHLRTTEVIAESEGEAFELASEDDYYFGRLVSIDQQYEIE